jgi:hypothetical protein
MEVATTHSLVHRCYWFDGKLYAKRYSDGQWFSIPLDLPLPAPELVRY